MFKLQVEKIYVVIFIVFILLLMTIIYLRCDVTDNKKVDDDTVKPIVVKVVESPHIESVDVSSDNAQDEIAEWKYDDNLTAEENIFIYLTKYLMFTDASACGIISNIAHETGCTFDPNAGDPSYNYGLIQWMGGRLSNLKAWCEENGKDYTTIQGQLDFMYWELTEDDPYGTYEHLMKCENGIDEAYSAAWYFCYWYERPYNKSNVAKLRGNSAKEYYETLVLSQD